MPRNADKRNLIMSAPPEERYRKFEHETGIDIDFIAEEMKIAEWFDWAKAEIALLGIDPPDDETLVRIIWDAANACQNHKNEERQINLRLYTEAARE